MEKYDLNKLGIVLGAQNDVIKESLLMLKEQQKRQVRMIWASLSIVLVAFIVVGFSMFCAFEAFNSLTEKIDAYHHGGAAYATTSYCSEKVSCE